MAPPIIERNEAARRHPGAEPIVYPLSERAPADDTATIRAIKGKGLVATITPHFAVAVIVGVGTAWFARRPDPVSENVGDAARRCNESVTQLRADFNQYKAEQSLANLMNEKKLNELLARTYVPSNYDRAVTHPIDSAVSRELSK
jgi:hypothetical protein